MTNMKFYIKTLIYNTFATLHLGKGHSRCQQHAGPGVFYYSQFILVVSLQSSVHPNSLILKLL